MTEDQLRAVIHEELAPIVEMMLFQHELSIWLHTAAKNRGAPPPLPRLRDA